MSPQSEVSRIEVIDDSGRVYGCWGCDVVLSYQDDGKTLKVFVTPNASKPQRPEPGWLDRVRKGFRHD